MKLMIKQTRSGNWWHDPNARPPHHKCRNIRLTPRLITASGNTATGDRLKRDPEALTKPHHETAEQAARRALQRLQGKAKPRLRIVR
jgi:hypothetical protein